MEMSPFPGILMEICIDMSPMGVFSLDTRPQGRGHPGASLHRVFQMPGVMSGTCNHTPLGEAGLLNYWCINKRVKLKSKRYPSGNGTTKGERGVCMNVNISRETCRGGTDTV